MTMRKLSRLLALLLALAMLAAACGRDDDDDGGSAQTEDTSEDDAASEGGGEPAETAGFDGTTITLGSLATLTDRVAIIGVPLQNGMMSYFNRVNDEGGIAGKYKIEVLTEDTKYDAPTAAQAYAGLKDRVVMFAQILGTPVVNAVLPQLKADNIVAQPATLDAFWVREQNLLPIGAPYQIQVINGMDWYINEKGSADDTICWVGTDDPYGEAGLEGMEFAAEELGFEIAAQPTFATTDTEFTAPINQLKSAGCQAVFGTFTAASLTGLLGAAAQQGFAPVWITQSPSWLSVFAGTALKDYLEANYYVVSEGPAWGDESAPGMAEMIEDLEKYFPDQAPDQYYAFGYVEARAVVQVLEKAVEMGDLSREGIIEAMNSLEALDFAGLLGEYSYGPPEDRNPPRANTISKINSTMPVGLELIVEGYESDAAKAYEFPTE